MPLTIPDFAKREKKFDNSISIWTLKFHDPDTESYFIKKYDFYMRLPLIGRAVAYICILYLLSYRVLAMYIVLSGSTMLITGCLRDELIAMGIFVVALMIEGLLHLTNRYAYARGLFIYSSTPIILMYTAFYTHGTPSFGITYALYPTKGRSLLAFMVIPFGVAAYLNNWRTMGLANILISLVGAMLYVAYFSGTTSTCIGSLSYRG